MSRKNPSLFRGATDKGKKREAGVDTKVTSPSSLSEENRIVIRIWLSKVRGEPVAMPHYIASAFNDRNKTNIGHVTIESPNYYASHWPAEDNSLFNAVRSSSSDPISDVGAEGGPADIVVCLYSLNVTKIDDAIVKLSRGDVNWTLFGDLKGSGGLSSGSSLASSIASGLGATAGKIISIVHRGSDYLEIQEAPQSCASSSFLLLVASGIHELVPNFSHAMKLAVKTPNNFATFIKAAKRAELEKYPESRDFHWSKRYQDDDGKTWADEEWVPPADKGCVLM